MVIAVTGQKGQLGSEFKVLAKDYPQYQFLFTDKTDLDITNKDAVDAYFKNHSLDVLINCAAYTAVDKAESESERAEAINHLAVRYLAEACKVHGVKMVHISTDYVFDGKASRPYKELDSPNPQGVYGQSKYAGEQALKRVNPFGSCIIRTSWLYSSFGHNFVKTMLCLGREREAIKVVSDQLGSPTYAADLAEAIMAIIPQLKNSTVETYHYANSGYCSWYEFATTIFDMKAIACDITPIKTSEYPTDAQRPKYSVLDTSKIQKTFGLGISNWQTSLQRCLQDLD
ncbi:dTDP-4-dehydrorhamnose reductase [uncultured Winogradskyella sp.]|uniref:dTDP-4-dehydrorhamnose reductase n=1 Tax=uncultured Winogradskyella sp. TaxID=395353 RepID=UPI003517F400